MKPERASVFARFLPVLLVVMLLAALLPARSAAGSIGLLYNSIPDVLPGGFPSLGYQATSTDEFGDHIRLALSGKKLQTVTVNMTNWACGNDYALVSGAWVKDRGTGVPCATTPETGFDHPLTLNLYQVDTTSGQPAPGKLIATKTITAFMYFRPSADPVNCPGSDRWYSEADKVCYNGYAFNVDFDFSADNLVLPDEFIFGLAYNTQTSGPSPLGAAGPYNSLNFSLATTAPAVGTNLDGDDVFWDTTPANGGNDTFRRDVGWTPYTPVVRFTTLLDSDGPAASSVNISPDPVFTNTSSPVTITAVLDDTGLGGSNIASAQVRLSGSSTWLALNAQDGGFDEISETVSGSFSPAELGLPPGGSASLCVRGTDSAGNTGSEACSTVQLRVIYWLPVVSR